MARDLDVVSSRGRLTRGALSVWAVLVYVFLFAPIVLLLALFRRSLEVEDPYGT